MTKTKKLRRHSGRVSPRTTLKLTKREIIDNCLEPPTKYSEWDNYRDGFRGYGDNTKIRSKNMVHAEIREVKRYNKKLKKLRKIRKVR